MKYSLTSGECNSPKSPEVVIFPPKFPIKADPFTDPKQVYTSIRPQVTVQPESDPISEDNSYVQVGSSTSDLISQARNRPHILNFPQRGTEFVPRDMRNKDCESADGSENAVDKQCVSKCSFYIVTTLAILATICAFACTGVMLNLIEKCNELDRKLNTAETSYTLAQQDVHLCLPCTELSQGPFEEENEDLEQLIKKEENGVQTCCAKTAIHLSIMLNLFAKRKRLEACAQESLEKENATASCNSSTSSTPGTQPPRTNGSISAHLVIGESQTGKGDEYHPIRHWRQGLPGTHLSNLRITAENSRIIVPETGLYYLYSQTGFLIYYDMEQADTITTQSLFHAIYRYNAIYPIDGNEELMRSVITQCWEKQKDYGRYTSYVGAAVKLHKGDQLYVKVSRIQDIAKDPSRTYFGMFKL